MRWTEKRKKWRKSNTSVIWLLGIRWFSISAQDFLSEDQRRCERDKVWEVISISKGFKKFSEKELRHIYKWMRYVTLKKSNRRQVYNLTYIWRCTYADIPSIVRHHDTDVNIIQQLERNPLKWMQFLMKEKANNHEKLQFKKIFQNFPKFIYSVRIFSSLFQIIWFLIKAINKNLMFLIKTN